MVESFPSPPVTPENTPRGTQDQGSTSSLTRRLDELLEQYLELLDQYTTLREEISKSLAAGFFSLARAQHNSSLGPGRRYGEDGFDGRMKALRRVKIATRGATRYTGDDSRTGLVRSEFDNDQMRTSESNFSIIHHKHANALQRDEPCKHDSQASEPEIQSSEGTTEHTLEKDVSHDATVKKEALKPDPGYRDPTTWYSILVPPLLRQAQQSFSVSIDETLPQLLNTISSMNTVENQIRVIRADIALDTSSSVKIEHQATKVC